LKLKAAAAAALADHPLLGNDRAFTVVAVSTENAVV
jgi:hypothetical protein